MLLQSGKLPLITFLFSMAIRLAVAQDPSAPSSGNIQIPLTVHSGVPFRVYIAKRLRMRMGEPVSAKLIDPIYAFDRIVVPSGAELQGHVTGFDPVSKMNRTHAILGGDFTPLHFARVEFTTLVTPDGHTRRIQTLDSEGLPTLYSRPRPSKNKRSKTQNNAGILGTARQQVQQQIQQQITSRSQSVIDVVRGPNKKEWLTDFLIKKMPYHPQWYRRYTRFDTVLRDGIDFGTVTSPADTLRSIGLPPGDCVAQVRLTTALSSADADTNTKVEGILSQPIFSARHQLILPEGTLLSGRVRQAQRARWFHRGGHLRFIFDRVQPPAWTSIPAVSLQRREIQLTNVEPDPQAHIKVDSEGDAKATESKLRFLRPAVALAVATRAMDNDTGRDRVGIGGANANYGGRTAGGFSGFGLLGSAASQASKPVGTVLGLYGLAWSVYAIIVSRGNEVEFDKNTAIEVRFGTQTPQPTSKVGKHVAGLFGH